MTLDQNVDRALAECWAISDHVVDQIRTTVASLKAEAARWEPALYEEETA